MKKEEAQLLCCLWAVIGFGIGVILILILLT
jgi:hypothetical protein